MSLLDSKFITVNSTCVCKTQLDTVYDGYANSPVISNQCNRCFGYGVVQAKMSLSELKSLLDGYSA